MKRLQLNTDDESLRDILANGKKYYIPRFQRDYSWEQEQWDDLWQDITAIVNGDIAYHYMGYLVIQPASENDNHNNRSKVIDGQQRLTTFSLLILAAIKRLGEMNDDERSAFLMSSFIGSKDARYLIMENKLILNRNNNFYYKQATKREELPKRPKKRTVRLMKDAIDFFYKQFKFMENGEQIGGFIDTMSEKLLFTTIYIGDELNAYKVFETLNARGVQLSSGDLIKNYLFSVIDSGNDTQTPDDVLDEYDQQWEVIGANIGGKNYSQYILKEWNSRHALVRKIELFANIKKSITDIESCTKYLSDLERKSDVYAALYDYDNGFWKDDTNHIKIKQSLYCLKLFNINQPISILLVVYDRLKKDFLKVLEWITAFSVRYNVICHKRPNAQEQLYSHIAVMIYQDNANLNDIKNKILELYPTDEEFKQAFSDTTLPTTQSNKNKRARYLLTRLTEHTDPSLLVDEQDYTIEHILPLNPNDDWIDYFGDNYDTARNRLGNMAIVTSPENKNLGQAPFAQKQQVLGTTACKINHSVCNYPQWNIESIDSRQRAMARLAVDVWKIQ